MFAVGPHDDGFLVTWESDGTDDAKILRQELLLEGLLRGREWEGGVVVRRYRNQFETLRLLLGVLERKGFPYRLDAELTDMQGAGEVERRSSPPSALPTPLRPSLPGSESLGPTAGSSPTSAMRSESTSPSETARLLRPGVGEDDGRPCLLGDRAAGDSRLGALGCWAA